MIEGSNSRSVFKLGLKGNHQMEEKKSRNTDKPSRSVKSKADRPTAEEGTLGKRSIIVDSQAEQSEKQEQDVPVSQAFPLMESVVDPMLQTVRKMRETTTNRMEKDLASLNNVTSTFRGPMGMDEKVEKQIKQIPAKALGMSRCLQEMNRFTSGKEKIQQQQVAALNSALNRTDQKKVEADDQMNSIRRREENLKPDAFEKRFHFGKELEAAINLHNNHVQVLGACKKMIPTLCIKCWGIYFVTQKHTIYLDRTTKARVAVPSVEVFQPRGPNTKSIRAIIESWAKCSKKFLKPDSDLTKPCIQDYFPFIVLPGEDSQHTCWDLDLVQKEDIKTILNERAKVLDAENSLKLLQGLDGQVEPVNNPQISSGKNSKRVFKLGMGEVPPLNLAQADPNQAINNDAGHNQVEQGQQPADPVVHRNPAVNQDPVEVVRNQDVIAADPPKAKKSRLVRKGKCTRSNIRCQDPADTHDSSVKLLPGEQRPRRPHIDLENMSSLASDLPQAGDTMNLLIQPGNWKYLTFIENGVEVKKQLSSLSKAFLSNN